MHGGFAPAKTAWLDLKRCSTALFLSFVYLYFFFICIEFVLLVQFNFIYKYYFCSLNSGQKYGPLGS